MWFFRETFRLIWMIALTTAIAAALALLWTLVGTGTIAGAPLHHSLRNGFLLFGAFLFLLAAFGNPGSASARRTNWGMISGFSRGLGRLSPPVKHRPGDPTLTPTAVFAGSAIVLLVLGAIL